MGGILRSQAELEVASPRNLQLWGLDSVEAYFETEDRTGECEGVFGRSATSGSTLFISTKARRLGAAPRRLGSLDVRLREVLAVKAVAAAIALLSKRSMRPPFVRVVVYAHHNGCPRPPRGPCAPFAPGSCSSRV